MSDLSDNEKPAGTVKKVTVIGLGPVGLILTTHLVEAGFETAVYDYDKVKLNIIRNEGIRLEGALQRVAKPDSILSGISELGEFKPDLVIACIKGYQNPAFVEQISVLRLENTRYVSAQNGIDVEQMLVAGLGENNVLRMVINFAGNLLAPNVVRVTFFNPPNFISSLDDSSISIAAELANRLSGVGLTTDAISSFQLLKRIWEKAILNSSLSALCGIGKLTIKEAMEMPDTVELIEQVIEEAVDVAAAEKIFFEDEFIRKCLRYLRKAGDHFPSLAVDLINGRSTEIDYMNGKIIEYGRKHYIRTPVNLAFTNMVKAMTIRSGAMFLKSIDPAHVSRRLNHGSKTGLKDALVITGSHPDTEYYLGVDLGSSYSKFVVIDRQGEIAYKLAVKTMNRDRIGVRHVVQAIRSEFNIQSTCATGYGRKKMPEADYIKTEINCAAAGVSWRAPGEKTIIDIGGEDIKVIHCGQKGEVTNFFLNDKCAAGTGSFITEIAERVELSISDMSILAARSTNKNELNSFCTVFAKTEIMKWLIEGMSVEDIAKGVYLSIANRVAKLRVIPDAPIYLVGGVIAYHPYLREVLEDKLKVPISLVEVPQFMGALGAARTACLLRNDDSPKGTESQTSTSNERPSS